MTSELGMDSWDSIFGSDGGTRFAANAEYKERHQSSLHQTKTT